MMENQSDDSRIKVKSLYKSLQLLSLFDQTHPERGITELAELSGMLKSSVHNIVSTFEAYRVLKRDPKTGKYQLGTRVLEFSNAYSASNTIDATLKPYMDDLSEQIGEVLHLAIPDQDRIVYVRSSLPKSMLNSFRHIRGVTADMYCTGVGKAMLAYMPKEIIEKVASSKMIAYTQNTITSRDRLLEELEEIREQGYAIDNMEHEYGVKCVSVPIFNSLGVLVGAVSATGPSLRMTSEKLSQYSKLLIELSQNVKYQLV